MKKIGQQMGRKLRAAPAWSSATAAQLLLIGYEPLIQPLFGALGVVIAVLGRAAHTAARQDGASTTEETD